MVIFNHMFDHGVVRWQAVEYGRAYGHFTDIVTIVSELACKTCDSLDEVIRLLLLFHPYVVEYLEEVRSPRERLLLVKGLKLLPYTLCRCATFEDPLETMRHSHEDTSLRLCGDSDLLKVVGCVMLGIGCCKSGFVIHAVPKVHQDEAIFHLVGPFRPIRVA